MLLSLHSTVECRCCQGEGDRGCTKSTFAKSKGWGGGRHVLMKVLFRHLVAVGGK